MNEENNKEKNKTNKTHAASQMLPSSSSKAWWQLPGKRNRWNELSGCWQQIRVELCCVQWHPGCGCGGSCSSGDGRHSGRAGCHPVGCTARVPVGQSVRCCPRCPGVATLWAFCGNVRGGSRHPRTVVIAVRRYAATVGLQMAELLLLLLLVN